MNTILLGFKLGIGLTLGYAVVSILGQILALILTKIIIRRKRKFNKPNDLNFG